MDRPAKGHTFFKWPHCQICISVQLDFLTSRTLKGRKLRKVKFWSQVLPSFYRGAKVKHHNWKNHKLTWFITAQDRKALQQVIKTAQNITGTNYSIRDKTDVCTEPKGHRCHCSPCCHLAFFFLCSTKEFSSVLFSSPGARWLMN